MFSFLYSDIFSYADNEFRYKGVRIGTKLSSYPSFLLARNQCENSPRRHVARRGGVTHTCADVRKLAFHTEASLQAAQARLKAPKWVVGITEHEELEKQSVWKLSELLGDAMLAAVVKPTRQVLFDTIHVLFSNGVSHFLVGRMLVALRPLGVNAIISHDYMLPWVWPMWLGTPMGKDVLSAARMKSWFDTSVLDCQLVLALLHTSLKALYRRSCGPVKPSYDLQFIGGERVGHEHFVHGGGEGASR